MAGDSSDFGFSQIERRPVGFGQEVPETKNTTNIGNSASQRC